MCRPARPANRLDRPLGTSLSIELSLPTAQPGNDRNGIQLFWPPAQLRLCLKENAVRSRLWMFINRSNLENQWVWFVVGAPTSPSVLKGARRIIVVRPYNYVLLHHRSIPESA